MSDSPWKNLKSFEKSTYSQCGEEGVIEQIFKLIGVKHRIAVDIGAADGFYFSNTQFLREDGWNVYMYDRDPGMLPEGKKPINYAEYKKKTPDEETKIAPAPLLDHVNKWHVTHLNVNYISPLYLLPRDIDLLSIDIDGQDYWVWKHIKLVARVVVIEFNAMHAPDRAVTVAPDPRFQHRADDHYGASFAALKSLGESKGYVLVHNCGSLNMIFVHKSALPPDFVAPDVSYEVKHDHPCATDEIQVMALADHSKLVAEGKTPAKRVLVEV